MAHALRDAAVEYIQGVTHMSPVECKDMEIGIFNWTIDFADRYRVMRSWKDKRFVSVYKNKLRSLLANLDAQSYLGNQRLLQRLKDGEMRPHEVSYLAPDHLFPEKWMDLLDRKLKKEESMLHSKQVAKTDQFRCHKCKKNECSYYELQVRSADESTTIFVTCLNCGNRWRIG